MKRKRLLTLIGSICLVLMLVVLLVAACAQPAPEETAADFFANNTVTLIVPYGAGGGTDYAARIFASYWSEVTGGTMIVKNKPGAGGVVAANFIDASEPDGLTMGCGVFGTGLVAPFVFEQEGVTFDLNQVNWVGFFASNPSAVAVSVDLPYESMEDLQKAEGTLFGCQGTKGAVDMGAALTIELFGLKNAKAVPGYGGSAEIGLAIAKGEVHAQAYESSVQLTFMQQGFTKKPFVLLAHERTDWFPDVPAVPELIDLTPEQDRFLEIFEGIFHSEKVFFTTPGVPADRVEFMRGAFDKIVAIESFVKQAKLRFPVWSEPVSGKDIATMVGKMAAIPQEDLAKFNQMSEKHF